MAFSNTVVYEAWNRARGRCECRRKSHNHAVPCGKQLSFGNRGREGPGKWEAHHRVSVAVGGSDALSNCEILCWDCHRATL